MSNATTKATQPKVREFHVMGVRLARPRMTLENRETLLRGRRVFRGTDPGFPPMPEIPRYVIHGPPRDMEQEEFYWVVSDRMKAVLEAVDREAFAFVKCEVRLRNGEPGPGYWLCDVMRIVDALDEAASVAEISGEGDAKWYAFAGPVKLVFRNDAVGSAHVFRMAHALGWIICDQTMKEACKGAGLKGVRFRDALNW